MEAYLQKDVEAFEKDMGANWPNIRKAREFTQVGRKVLEDTLSLLSASLNVHLPSDDISIVVFGSLARKEFTSGSDIDWTLLIDGCANPQHLDIALKFKEELEKKKIEDKLVRGPGIEATFGGLAFSHDIIHNIGGGDDTNKNTTQRILLLLESASIGHRYEDKSAHERVKLGVLNRYIYEDRAAMAGEIKVPRFLLNDIVRYWRTMAVDFGYKRKQQQGKKAALRSVKLRLSRKLIYVSGLLACFACEMDKSFANEVVLPEGKNPLVDYLYRILQHPPLDILASIVLSHVKHSHQPLYESGKIVMDNYDEFLRLIDDNEKREHLEKLLPQETDSDPVYREAKAISDNFQKGLDGIFFSENGSELFRLIKKYGVF